MITGLGIKPASWGRPAPRKTLAMETAAKVVSLNRNITYRSAQGDQLMIRFGSDQTNHPGSKVHMINDVPYKTPDGHYQMVVEIPAGTNEKWQTDAVTGDFYHDTINGVPRVINFLPYPMNYGYIPQTLLSKAKGGDGDPTDIITLAPMSPRGTVSKVRVLGALKLEERGEQDTKIVAVLDDGPFKDVQDIPDLLMKYPGTLEIVRLWFEGYKGPGSFLFQGYADKKEAQAIIEESHLDWQADMQAKAKP